MQQIEAFRVEGERLRGATIDGVWVFGSQARGDAGPDSDTDLIVVSGAFAAMPFLDRCARMRRAWPLDRSVDLVCLTPAEFEERRLGPTFVREAVESGITVP